MNVLFQINGQRTSKTFQRLPYVIIPIQANSQGLPAPHLMNGRIVTYGPLTVPRITPRIVESQGLGWIFNCKTTRHGDSVTGELWINQGKAHSIAPALLNGELHIEAIINNNHLSYIKVLPIRATTTNEFKDNSQQRRVQIMSIKPMEMPAPYHSAKSSDIALVRSNLVALHGNEQGTRRLTEMTAQEITTAANALVDNSGNGGCCQQSQIANIRPGTIEPLGLPDYSAFYKGVR